MIETEGKGVDYERYALRQLFHALVHKYGLESILEIPAKGEKAMPSIYSLAFAEAGCRVALVNPEPLSMAVWQDLELPVICNTSDDLAGTDLPSSGFDLVWDFHYLSRHPEKTALLNEMIRLSARYILHVGVNRFNPGFLSHRLVHRLFSIPWNHGDTDFMSPFHVSRFFRAAGLDTIRIGVVDAPPFPDSLGIRDLKLHKKGTDLNKIRWHSRTIGWMKNGSYPQKLKAYYLFEKLPLPFPAKLTTSHLFYVLSEKRKPI